jgi:hypothetical protein
MPEDEWNRCTGRRDESIVGRMAEDPGARARLSSGLRHLALLDEGHEHQTDGSYHYSRSPELGCAHRWRAAEVDLEFVRDAKRRMRSSDQSGGGPRPGSVESENFIRGGSACPRGKVRGIDRGEIRGPTWDVTDRERGGVSLWHRDGENTTEGRTGRTVGVRNTSLQRVRDTEGRRCCLANLDQARVPREVGSA